VGIGATIRLAERLAVIDPLLIKLILSKLTVESRHDVFFWSIEGKVVNPLLFDTGISNIWAYNLAISFIVPGNGYNLAYQEDHTDFNISIAQEDDMITFYIPGDDINAVKIRKSLCNLLFVNINISKQISKHR